MSNENTNATTSTTENQEPKPGTKAYVEAELAAAKAEIEALKAQAAESAAAKAEAPAVPEEERVDLFVDKGYANDEPNHIISVNGVMYVLPKGKTSKVPQFVADEYYRSKKAQQRLDDTVDKMLAEASK